MEALEAPALSTTMAETLGDMVDALVGIDAMMSGLMGVRSELLNDMRAWGEVMEAANEHSTPTSRDLSRRSMRAEVACALRLPERTVESLFATSRILISQLPDTMAALKAGRVTYQHAQVIADDAAGLSAAHATALERLALPVAETSTVVTLRNKSRALREGLCPDTIAERAAAAVEAREVSWQPGRDGMGWLTHYLSAPDGLAIMSRASEAASLLKTTTEPRTLTQLRSDVLRDAMLDGVAGISSPVRPDVYVTVPVFTLMGLSEQPASLEGYGPIDAETARRLVANSTGFTRILTHPETGVPLSMSRERYSAPVSLRRHLRHRGPTCGFFGCNRAAADCDLDHTIAWEHGGNTDAENLAYLCRAHHVVKHNTPWSVQQTRDGTGELTWTAPSGRAYVKTPDRDVPTWTGSPPF
ncbi:MAG: DUF222 domain-containing protein [Rhodoglobus sp.]